MLNLASQTDAAWIDQARQNIDEILIDHAHCEKKAASTALSLIFRYPQYSDLMVPLSQLAREELAHFEIVLGHLKRRGVAFRRLKPSPYAGELLEAVRPREPERALDTLLCLALIEARSCERMKLLAEGLDDPELCALYAGLLASEARHHQSYIELAETIAPETPVRRRLAELARHEAQVLGQAPRHLPRIHT
ncbi:MAG: tRNA-(ms[2]io[6]A)-hydroxylase [bacterium]|jgi:tRNA-(ms[2]io[6]A)-hydroxylase